MVFERTEQEPEEYDPEAELHDPESDTLTIPRVQVPTVEEGGEIDVPSVEVDPEDVPADVRKNFWLLVGSIKVAMLTTSLGVILLAFGHDRTVAIACGLAGLALFGLTARRYRNLRAHLEDAHADGDDDGEGDATGSTDSTDAARSASDPPSESGSTTDTQP